MITIYVTHPITDAKILPTSVLPPEAISNQILLNGSAGEYRPATFTIHTTEEILGLLASASDLVGDGGLIPSSNIDIRVVKCWYQSGVEVWDTSSKILTPELLLKDDSLVKVEEGENYLKLTTGEYLWISDPTLVDAPYRPRTIEEIPVRDSPTLQSVDIPNGTNKQFWVTIEIPDNATPGIYTGKIQLSTPGGLIGEIELTLEVLPIELAPPYLTYSIYYVGVLNPWWPQGSISHNPKSEEQLRAEMRNLLEHGVTNPAIYQDYPGDPSSAYAPDELLREFLAIRNEMGMGGQPLYFLGLKPWGYQPVDKVAEVIAIAQSYGIPEVYFFGVDEATGQALLDQRASWQAIREAGGKIFVDCDYDAFERVGDLLDLAVRYGPPTTQEAAKWHSVGHKVFCYSNPQVGVEKPETYRRNFGLLLWQKDYDGAMDFAYQYGFGSIWNDFDNAEYRDHVFAYPTVNGVIDTIQWEGWREGVTDVRYLTTLLNTIDVAKSQGIDTSEAESYLSGLKAANLSALNLDDVRQDIIDHILYLQGEPVPPPPPPEMVGNLASILAIGILVTLVGIIITGGIRE